MPLLHGIFETGMSVIIAMFQYHIYTYKLSSVTVTAIAVMSRWWCDHPRLALQVVQFVATQKILFMLGRRRLCGHDQVQICAPRRRYRMSIGVHQSRKFNVVPLVYVNGDAPFLYGGRSETHAQATRRAVERKRNGRSHSRIIPLGHFLQFIDISSCCPYSYRHHSFHHPHLLSSLPSFVCANQ